MHSAEEYMTTAAGGALGGTMAMANGISLLSIDWTHTAEYGINLLLGTLIVTGVKFAADMLLNSFRKTKRRRRRNAAPRRIP